MSRPFLVPVALPADPTQALHAVTKQYVDAMLVTSGQAPYRWSTNTAISDPGHGMIKANDNVTPSAATYLCVSLYDVNGYGHPELIDLRNGDEIAIYETGVMAKRTVFTIDFSDPINYGYEWVQLAVIPKLTGSGGFSPAANAAVGIDTIPTAGSQLSAVPAGTIIAFGGPNAPGGYFLCNGAAISRTGYSKLFTAIGTTWGAGDGTNTFNLPDLMGRSPIGAGAGAGLTARTVGQKVGAETHALSIAEMPLHNHAIATNARTIAATGSEWAPSQTAAESNRYASSNAGSGAAHNNMQPSGVVLYCIRNW